ncbi:MAG: hypothetical protein PHV06_00165 [bacterium]|nr:hypothetical protein [bacterium]
MNVKDKRYEILKLLEEGKITSQEALEMLDSLALYNELKTFKGEFKSSKKSDSKFIELQ